ncbi:Type I restriction-modification system, restriction subunit R [Methanosarcina mazei Tuc01]|uniref:Type I restriction-modification system, restriction subunit R n=1 Tax=Methanosarcina mazei Tuc01 TaxID=1236903 RepID=M1QM27_METMZ|nr:hypothetical protein [Methanosarcina mazei]AGF98079.1 Type I restriction-modification system, restriction subunit R [Methanosarcina mazei Tuc01]
MHDKVQKYWNQYIEELKEQRKAITESEEAKDLEKLISEFENVDMAVVISEGQDYLDRPMKDHSLMQTIARVKIYKSILPHRRASEFLSQITLYEELINEIHSE